MVAFGRARASVCAAVLAAASLSLSGNADARPKVKPRPPQTERVSDSPIPIPKFSSGNAAEGVRRTADDAPAPMRFFTINGALAKFESRSNEGAPVRHAAVAPSERTTDLPPPPVAPAMPLPGQGDEPFGMYSFRAPHGTLWVKWSKVQSAFAAEDSRIRDCRSGADACDGPSRAFNAMVARASALQGRARFEAVTHAANAAVRYTSDLSQHGAMDLWTAPLATLAAGRGDCEDYAILKYQVLREAGTPAADLKIVLLRDTATREDHAVLAARSGERWYILDNRRAGFYADADLPHYLPLFALTHDGVQLFAAPYALRPSLPAEDTPVPATGNEAGLATPALIALPILL